jgi:hypothetical protein
MDGCASAFLLRQAVAADMDVLRDLFRRSSLSNDGDRGHLLDNPDALEFSQVGVNDHRTRVATCDGRIVGFAIAQAHDKRRSPQQCW